MSSEMDSKQNASTTSAGHSGQIKPFHTFGVSKGVRNNLLFPDEETVIFPSGNHCVRYNIHQQGTQFIYGAKGRKGIQTLALSPDRRYLAVSEIGKWGTITIFDLEDEAYCKKQVLKGSEYGVHEFVCMAFSADSKYLLGQAGGPTWTLFYWKWEEKELIASVNTTRSGRISQVSFNPQDDTQICVSGRGVFRIFEMKVGDLKQANSYKMENEDVLCHVWMSKDCIVAGTDTGKLLMLKSRQLHRLKSPFVRQTENRDSLSSVQQWPVTAITSYSKGFVCSAGRGLVCLYEKAKEKDSYEKTVEIRIPVDSYSSQELQAISTMCISPAEETLAISTDRGQLYCVSLSSSAFIESKNTQFRFLSHSFHSDSITGLSSCVSKPIVATCSKDRTMYIWNYKKKSLEKFKEFDDEPLCVSLHPNGLSILVGFTTEVCLMKMLHDSIYIVQRFHINNCTECVFNHDGNRFAAISKNLIHIYNIRTYETTELSGHRKKVQSVKWSNDDHRLVSCGMDGTVCIWNALTGDLVYKNMNDCCYTDVIFLPNTGSILALDRVSLQEIQDERSVWEMATDGVAYTSISMTHSGQTIFVGTTAGTVRVIEYPFSKERPLIEHHAHSGPITKMVVTPCDLFLLTASKDGSLLIWAITDKRGRTLERITEMDYTEEVLCTKAYLEEKDQTVNEYKSQVEWLKVEQEHNLHVKDVDCYEKTNNIIQNYLQQIETLKDQIQELIKEKEDQKVSHQKVMTELQGKHAKELEDQELSHVEGMTGCYEKQCELEQKIQMLQKKHEKKLQETEDSHFQAMEDMKQGYEETVQKLQVELEKEVKDSAETQKKLKDHAESELMDFCRNYEHDLQEEKEAKLRVKDEQKTMEKNISKYLTMKRELKNMSFKIYKLEEEVQTLTLQLKVAKGSIKDLTAMKDKQSKTIRVQEYHIEELQESIGNLELSSNQKQEELAAMILERKKTEEESSLKSDKERIEFKRLEREVQENKDTFKLIGAEMEEAKKKYKKIITDQEMKLKSKDKALITEKQRVIDINIMVRRMKDEIHNCAYFIQDPKKLRENFIELHNRYIHEPDMTIGVETEVIQEHTKHMEHFQNILDTEKKIRAREIKNETDRYVKLMKENSLLIEQLNDQRLRHRDLLTSHKKENVQSVNAKASSPILPRLWSRVNQRLKRNLLEKRQISAPQGSPG